MVILNYLYKISKKVYCVLYNPIIKKTRCFRIVDYLLLYMESYKSYRLMRLKFKNFKSYCFENNIQMNTIEPTQMRSVCIPDYLNTRGRIELYLSPEIYITEVETIKICGECGAIIRNKTCLFDVLTQDKEKRYDCAFKPLIRIEKNRKYGIIKYLNNKIEFIDKGIFLIGFAPYNYYHATIEIISRLEYVNNFSEYDEIPILVDEVISKTDSLNTILNMVNKTKRKIIWIERHRMYNVGKLIYLSNNCWMPINLKNDVEFEPKDFLISKSAILNIRKNVLNEVYTKPYRKIFLSRGESFYNRLCNEKEVEELFYKKGFEIVNPGIMKFEDQVQLFREAAFIASTSGAALTNLIYCSEGIKFACIFPQKRKFYLYSTIANLVGIESCFIDATIINEKNTISKDQYICKIIDIYSLFKRWNLEE